MSYLRRSYAHLQILYRDNYITHKLNLQSGTGVPPELIHYYLPKINPKVSEEVKSKIDELLLKFVDFWRCHPDLNRGIRVLQTRALPLGYGTTHY